MPFAPVGRLRIAYDSHGNPADPTVVLVSGLGRQLLLWPMAFVYTIVIAGYHVVRFDNRDVGLSSHLTGKLNLSDVAAAIRNGTPPDVPYLLSDMAADTIGLLDHIDVAAAHVVGISMGGAIAQEMAIRTPHRLRSLTCIMSTTGAPDVGQPNATGNRALFRAPPLDRDRAIDSMTEAARLLASPGFFDAAAARLRASWAHDRAFDPQGPGRQLGAIWASGDRTAALRSVSTPTLVLHGDHDPLVDVTGGRAIAAAIPGTRYIEIAGMAHDLNEAFWPELLQPMLEHLAAQ